EPIVQNFLITALGCAGYEVVTATDAMHARRLFDAHAPDLALMALEIALPGMSGPEFVGSLPTLKPRIPVVFLTCLGESEVAVQPVQSLAPIMQKPFSAA